ncbi:Putative odorant receptor [Gryllus bimaculatus]|nr:Putative odorant receptor [Gryllus bimaculatus]
MRRGSLAVAQGSKLTTAISLASSHAMCAPLWRLAQVTIVLACWGYFITAAWLSTPLLAKLLGDRRQDADLAPEFNATCTEDFTAAPTTEKPPRPLPFAVWFPLNTRDDLNYGIGIFIQSQQVANDVYCSQWFRCSVSTRKSVYFVMLRAFTPSVVNVSGFTVLGLDLFSALIRASYSMLALLQQVNND